ncbi:MAG: response regulator [Gemmatimonadota bacterium]
MTLPEHRCRVLVIDDNADIRESVATVISLLGHDVLTASDGEEGVRAGRELQPDLVLMDVGLPGLSGYDVAQLMRAEPWGQRAVLAAMTGWAQESDRLKAEAAGFDVHVPKPVELKTLRELIARAGTLPRP